MSLPLAVLVTVANEVSTWGDKVDLEGVDGNVVAREYHHSETLLASESIGDVTDRLPKVVIEELT